MKRLPLILVIILTMGFAGIASWYNVTAYNKLNIHRFDLGNAEQLVWNVAHGRGFVMTDPYGTATVSRFAFHIDPFLALLALPYALWNRAETLIVIQVLAVASGLIAAYLLGKKILKRPWFGLVAALMLAGSAPTQWATIFPVHAVTFATPLILWLVWAALAKRWRWMWVFLLLVLMTKEEVGFSLAVFGLWLWWIEHERRIGLAVAATSVAWALTALLLVLPAYHQQTNNRAEVYSSPLGNSAASIVQTAVQHPVRIYSALVTRENVNVGTQILASTGWLAIGNPLTLAAVPDFAINALSDKPQQKRIVFHYQGAMIPWLIIGALLTIAAIERRWPRLLAGYFQVGAAVWLIGWVGVTAYGLGPLPGTPADRLKFATWRNEYAAPVLGWAKTIPDTARVSATNNVGAHFARREHLYTFPVIGDADYVIVLEHHGSTGLGSDADVSQAVSNLKSNPAWEVLLADHDLSVLRRRP